ncbi:MAG: prepilin-type N-terminal cleavage/methylation domain-containing protein [Candidatus Yonathbacteria bacterium]|nr:prepilin-type N-terminal cleavage/methylation domain-containing protein [Candidatus Yonathbacteria bacterium]
MISPTNTQKRDGGLTLLELLIVIAIIAILSIALVFMLNPAETLKKARDAQRISDLKSVKTALGIMLTASSTPRLDSSTGVVCTTNTVGASQTAKIAYSASTAVTSNATAGGDDIDGIFASGGYTVTAANAGKVDGNGWIPVNLKALTGGTPISSFPVDPINTVTAAATSTDLVYRYGCQNLSSTKPSFIFEIDARLESNAYTVEDNKMSKDGGDNISFYESGNSLNLLPETSNF